MRARLKGLAAAALAAVAVAGCGVPTRTDVRTVPDAEVPYALLAPTPASPGGSGSSTARPGAPTVFLLRDERLVPTALAHPTGPSEHVLAQIVAALSAGPDDRARARGLGTAIPPSLTLTVRSLEAGVATIDLGGDDAASVGDQGPLAIGQVVLSASSLAAVDAVLLTRQGSPIDAQLAGGALTSRPLTRADYRALVDGST